MLNNEDIISNVAYAIMTADIKWDQKRGKTLYSYRNQCGIWAIKRYIIEKATKPIEQSLDELISNKQFYEVDNKNGSPLICLINTENKQLLHKAIERLSSREQHIIFLRYFDGKKYQEIGKIYKISKQRVYQIVQNIHQKLSTILE